MREMQCRVFVIFALLLAVPASARPQTRQHRFGRITIDDGLSSYRAYDAVQDSLGFLWVGTLKGLDRYDGYGFVHFRHDAADSLSLSNDMARTLLVDRSGTLWVGTDAGGLNQFDSRTEHFRRYRNDPLDPQSISAGRVTSLCEDRTGVVWIGTLGGGLSGYTAGKPGFVHFRHSASGRGSLCNDRVNAICEGDPGKLWIGTEDGLDEFDRETGVFTHFRHSPRDMNTLSGDLVTSVFRDAEGTLWIGVGGGGLNRFEPRTGRVTRYRHDGRDPGSLSHDDVSCIYGDDPGILWVGTSDVDGGLNRLDKRTGRFARFMNDPLDPGSLLHNYVRKIRPGRAGSLWIVTDRGVNRLDKRQEQFRHYTIGKNSSVPQSVSALLESRDGRALWIGSTGLMRIDVATGSVSEYSNNPGFVQGLYEDGRGSLWFGTTSGGLEKLDPRSGRKSHFNVGFNGHAGYVFKILEGRNGLLWIGTADVGLLSLDPSSGVFVRYANDPADPGSLANNAVFALLEDTQGRIWAGTEGGGLNRLENGGRFTRYRHDPARPGSLPDDRIYALHEDRRGKIWVGTTDGIGMFDVNTERYAPVSLPVVLRGMVMRILEDERGFIWFSTLQNGLFRVDPETGQSRNFDATDGLQGNNFSSAAFPGRNGELMFGGENGYNVFAPDSIRDNPSTPSVVLTDFSIFGKPAVLDVSLTQVKRILLRYDQNFFSFEFSSLDLTAPARNLYAYRLEGIDTAWVFPVRRRYASYTNIDPGTYTLRVRGSNNDGVWNEAGLSIPITITPPYWATWWFRALVALCVISVMAGAYRYRVSKLLEMERMRLRIATDLHDDIGSSLGSIALITDMVRRSLPPGLKSGEQLQDASSAARRTADSLRDIVWLISPDHDRLDDIVLRMKDAAAKLLVGIEYGFDCPPDALDSTLDMEFRRHVWLIYKETLHNIAKYANARRVDIGIKADDGVFRLRIKDDGVGFDTTRPSSGNGLRNLRARAAKVGGSVTILSAPGEGTTVQLEAKIP